MNYYLKRLISVVLLLSSINFCKSQNANSHPTACIKLNDEGVSYLNNYPENGEIGLNKAITLFKQAIDCDSTNIVFYNNLASRYDRKHNYNGEMVALDKILLLTANDPSFLTQKGMLLEVKGSIDSAQKTYHLTQFEYHKRLSKDPDNVSLIRGMILLIGIIDGKDAAIKALNQHIKAHPKISSQLSQEYSFYQYFNRHDFVFRLPTVT